MAFEKYFETFEENFNKFSETEQTYRINYKHILRNSMKD